MTEFIRKNDKFGVSKRFCDAFKGLPKKWDPEEYYKFLDKWGTVWDCTFNNISLFINICSILLLMLNWEDDMLNVSDHHVRISLTLQRDW